MDAAARGEVAAGEEAGAGASVERRRPAARARDAGSIGRFAARLRAAVLQRVQQLRNRLARAEQLAGELALTVSNALRGAIAERGAATLVVSGGRSPIAFFERLAESQAYAVYRENFPDRFAESSPAGVEEDVEPVKALCETAWRPASPGPATPSRSPSSAFGDISPLTFCASPR